MLNKKSVFKGKVPIGGFTVTSYAVLRGRLAPLVGKIILAGELRVYLCLDSLPCLHSFCPHTRSCLCSVLVWGTSGIVWTARFSLLSKKMENEENSG